MENHYKRIQLLHKYGLSDIQTHKAVKRLINEINWRLPLTEEEKEIKEKEEKERKEREEKEMKRQKETFIQL